MNTTPPQANRSLHRTLWILLILVMVGMLGYSIRQSWNKVQQIAATTLPTYGVVGDFSLTEASGRPFTAQDLLGKVWVADFIFTTCPGPCPILSQRMQQLQHALNKTDNVKLVSFTVDPETDTPPVLLAYAHKYFADPQKWFFLTGTDAQMQQLAEKTFSLPRTRNPDDQVAKVGRFLHSTRFVLVDTKGVIRGYYDSLDPEYEQHLLQDIGFLMKEAGL
jgi:protein SCO1/2